MFPVKYRYFFFTLLIAVNALSQAPQIVVPVGHTQSIISCRFSPDGKYIATSSRDNTIKIWDIKTGRLLHTISTGKTAISIFSFSSGSRYIMTQSSVDSVLTVWDIYKKGSKPVFHQNKYFNKQTTFSPDEKKLVLQSDSTVEVWGINAVKKIQSFFIQSKLSSYRKIDACNISNNSKWIAASFADSIYIWEISTGRLLKKGYNKTSYLRTLNFSADDNFIFLKNSDNLVKIAIDNWKATLLCNMQGTSFYFSFASGNNRFVISESKKYYYKKDGMDSVPDYDAGYKYQLMLTDCETGSNFLLKPDSFPSNLMSYSIDNNARQIIVNTGENFFIYKRYDNQLKLQTTIPVKDKFYYPSLVADSRGNFLALYSSTYAAVYDNTGKKIYSLQGNMSFDSLQYFSNDGKYIFTSSGNHKKNAWNVYTGKTENVYDHTAAEGITVPDNKFHIPYIVKDTLTGLFNLISGFDSATVLEEFKNYRYQEISPHNKYAGFYAIEDSAVHLWDIKMQKKTAIFKNELGTLGIREFSNNDSLLVCGDNNSEYLSAEELDKMWDDLQAELDAWNEQDSVKPKKDSVAPVVKPKKRISCLKIFSLKDQKQVFEFIDSSEFHYRTHAYFSGKAKNLMGIVCGKMHVWETKKWSEIFFTENICGQEEPSWALNANGSKIVITCKGTATLYENYTNKKLFEIPGAVSFASFSEDDKYILTESEDKQLRIWNPSTGKLVYTYFALENGSYLTTDEYGRYDGSEDARKKLYYVCGDEVIDLDQVKDQLWVPNLAERIMKGDTINASKLSDLNICGLTPLVQKKENQINQYQFQITPRRGGLGETILYINNIEVSRFNSNQLVKNGNSYLLQLNKKDLEKYFIAGQKNLVVVKALTANNTITSRADFVEEQSTASVNNTPPNLYAVIVGISDYKGEELDLHYAAKDAKDFAGAVDITAKKLLNTDGKEHVFVYKLHTEEGRDKFPEKNSIQQTLKEIAGKATPNDILLIFFAGHGKMVNKQFYFITADASKNSVTEALPTVSISTKELTDWIQPSKIKAQKRILIFDACNSGQAINDIITVGNTGQNFIAARDDDNAEQIKTIEKINEKSGLFILSASASDKPAYEMSQYSQGLLTYSLLQAIKQQPDILDNQKYINISRWFNAAEKTVEELTKESNARQQPQVVSTTNFNIGVVDEEVRNKIVLPDEKILFTRSEFRNTDLKTDNLKLRALVDKQMTSYSGQSNNEWLLFNSAYEGENVYMASGDYKIDGNKLEADIIILKNTSEKKFGFSLSGSVDQLNKFSAAVINKILDWIKSQKQK